MATIGVIGTGKVGGEIAFVLAMLNPQDKIILHDINKPLLNAQYLDIINAFPEADISTDIKEIRDADFCIYTAGFSRKPDMSRVDLLKTNLDIAEKSVDLVKEFTGIFITVTNPVDILNYYFSNHEYINTCIGFGGLLDSARFERELRNRKMDFTNSVIIGEHGDHLVPLFSNYQPDHVPVEIRDEILASLRKSAMEIIKGKGGTIFGPAYHIVSLIEHIVLKDSAIIPCSVAVNGDTFSDITLDGCSVGLPVRITKKGDICIQNQHLDEWEQQHLIYAVEYLEKICKQVKVP